MPFVYGGFKTQIPVGLEIIAAKGIVAPHLAHQSPGPNRPMVTKVLSVKSLKGPLRLLKGNLWIYVALIVHTPHTKP